MEQPLKNPIPTLSNGKEFGDKNPSSNSTGNQQQPQQKIKRKQLPTAQELITHYESQGLDPRQASLKVIDDLQKALFRVVTSSSSSASNSRGGTKNIAAETSRKLDVINARLVNLDMKLDSKPGYPLTLAIGVASAAGFHGLQTLIPHVAGALFTIWNTVRSATSPNNQ